MIRQSRTILGILAAVGAMAPAAVGQVTTPPPPAPEAEPAYTPPPKPAARPAPTPAPSQGARGSIPQTPTPEHKALAQMDEDGMVIRLDEVLDEVALQRNPYVGPTKNDAINAVRVERRAQVEKMVIENLDLFLEIESGVINELRMLEDFEEFQGVVQKIPPLVLTGSLSSQLAERGVLTRIQSQSTNQIVRLYNAAINDEYEKLYPDNHLDHFMKFIINESLKDARHAYRGMVEELIDNADELGKLSLSPNAKPAVEAAAQLQGREDAVEQLRLRLSLLSLDEHQALLRAVRDLRANPEEPRLEMLDFQAENAIAVTPPNRDKTMVRIKNPDGTFSVRPYGTLMDGQEYMDGGKTLIKGQEEDADASDADG